MKEIKSSLKWVVLTFVISLAALYIIQSATIQQQRRELGEQAVRLMYQFTEIEQLQFNMIDLKEITTDPVFNQLTIDNEDRTLYTYVKFLGNPTSVNIIKSTSTYVLYSISNTNIDEERRFIFMFDCDNSGKISYVREAEIYDFNTYAD